MPNICFFLAIAPQGKIFGILYLDSHITLLSIALSPAAAIVSKLYIFCVRFFLAIAPQGEIFLGIISELNTKFFGIYDCFFTGQGKIPHPPPQSGEGGGGELFFIPPPSSLGGIFDISE